VARASLRVPFSSLVSFFLIALQAGCGSDKPKSIAGPGGTSGGTATFATYSGVLVSSGKVGSVSLTIDFTDHTLGVAGLQYAVTGYFVPEGQDTIPMDGQYESRTGGLSVSASDYTFSGSHSMTNGSETIDGSWVGPNESGWFGTSRATAQHRTAAYAGTYDGSGAGFVVLLATDSALRGQWYSYVGTPLAVHGSLGPGTSTQALNLSGGAFPFVVFNASGSLTVSTQAMQGTWRRFNNFDPAGNGNWTAARLP
jgi:hypothetical protein